MKISRLGAGARAFGACASLLFSSLTVGYSQIPMWKLDGASFTTPAEEIQKAAAAIPAEKFAEATVLFERESYQIDAAGRVVYRHAMITRIETKAGVEDWAESSERWEPWYQKMPEIHARVIAPDGKVSQLDQKTITDGPASEQDEDTYTDARIRKAPLPGLTVGAIVEDETVVEDKEPFFPAGGVYRDFFARDVPVVRSELIVEAAKELKLRYQVHMLPQVAVTDEEQDGKRRLKFVQGFQAARPESDIHLPTHQISSPMVEFSTGESWAAVAAGYRELAEGQIDAAKVKALLPAELPSERLAAIQRILSRLHKEVRYTGIEFGEAALKPETAAEVLKRHYGDCKDKAALLVGLLRAAGMAANMALLDTGPGEDVTPELPGMNRFDHAIVYLPADGKGGEALWIDATAEYTEAGSLPSMDRGRLALIIADGTSTLTMTPEARPEDDVLTELRDVTMAEYGPSHITETSLTHGEVDASYREDFGEAETRRKNTNLEAYAKRHYLAKALTGVEHGDGKDFSKPFTLKLDMAEAKRGNTGIDDAAVAIPYTGLLNRLPEWFTTDPNPNGEKLTPQQEEDQKKAVLARATEYDVHPQVTEWKYRIQPPAGFVLRALPEDKSTSLGPAKLTQHYEADSKGAITADLRFETGKAKYTVEEALALREAVLAAYKQDMVMVMFDQEGSKLLAAGKIREALETDRGLIEIHPKEALHHAQIAYAFLKAGMGDRAQAEAQTATLLDPKSAVAFQTLGWMCQFNAIGVQYAQGFDWSCAAAAYKKALELDAEDINTGINLAVLDEYDAEGQRYSAGAHLEDAIRQYRTVKEKDKETGEQYEDNLLFDLYYTRAWKDLLHELEGLPSSVTRNALGISAVVAQTGGTAGVKAGVDRADRLSAGAEGRSSALVTAGNQLVRLQLYPETAGILSAAVEGQSNAAGVTEQIELFRTLTPWKKDFLPKTDPRSVVQRMFMTMMTGGWTEASGDEFLTHHAYGSEELWKRNLAKAKESRGLLHMLAAQSGLPANVLLDVIAGNMKFSSEGDEEHGYRVTIQSLGAKPVQFFVSKDDGAFRVVTDGKDEAESGYEVLYLLENGREAEARSLLDWTRDKTHRGGGDDPLSGPLLPRFWTVGDAGGREQMELAAASMIVTTPSAVEPIKRLEPGIRAAWEKEQNEERRVSLGLLLASLENGLEDGPRLKEVSAAILAKYPESYVAISLAGAADRLLKDWSDWSKMLEAQIAKHPDDEILLRMKVEMAEAEGDFPLARATEQQVMDKGKALANDYNMYAWTSLFDGKVDEASVKAAQQASMLNKDSTFAELHTLACIYAVKGKTSEARELLLKAMTAENLSEPNSEIWFGFGSIFEQYGIHDAAIEAYRKVDKPYGHAGSTDTYTLAQMRIKALGGQ